MPARRVGLLGLGAIGETVARALTNPVAAAPGEPAEEVGGVEGTVLVAVLVTDCQKHTEKLTWLNGGTGRVLLTSDPEEFFAAGCDVVVEAAGQESVSQFGEQALKAGTDLIISSTGALTDDSLRDRLHAAARSAAGGRLHLASGAMPGLDWMQAVSMGAGGAQLVSVTQSKPPYSWYGTCAEGAVRAITDWDEQGPLTVFEGVARDAARQFPKSSNVTATLAFATAGLDNTRVKLVADPKPFFSTLVELQSQAGTIRIQAEHQPSSTNPRTSADVALSILRSLRATCSPFVVGT